MASGATKVGVYVQCTVCGQQKQPNGRDGGFASYCTWECGGYYKEPRVGQLWPGETDAEYGYPCGDDGTRALDAAKGGR